MIAEFRNISRYFRAEFLVLLAFSGLIGGGHIRTGHPIHGICDILLGVLLMGMLTKRRPVPYWTVALYGVAGFVASLNVPTSDFHSDFHQLDAMEWRLIVHGAAYDLAITLLLAVFLYARHPRSRRIVNALASNDTAQIADLNAELTDKLVLAYLEAHLSGKRPVARPFHVLKRFRVEFCLLLALASVQMACHYMDYRMGRFLWPSLSDALFDMNNCVVLGMIIAYRFREVYILMLFEGVLKLFVGTLANLAWTLNDFGKHNWAGELSNPDLFNALALFMASAIFYWRARLRSQTTP